MFISTAEKEEMQRSISYLLGEFSKLWSDYLVLKAKIKVLEGGTKAVQPKKKKPLTAAQKVKQRQYQKAYNERKKAKLIAEKLLTKEANVSS
jgi:hypothetical protein